MALFWHTAKHYVTKISKQNSIVAQFSYTSLKVVSATLLLVYNKEKCFLFHFESSSRSWHFRYSNIITPSNAQAWNTKHILLNNLGSKCSLVTKFGQFMQYYKIIFFIKKFYEKCGVETSFRPFLIFKESSVKKIMWRSACWFG